jgi:hypothetical protein
MFFIKSNVWKRTFSSHRQRNLRIHCCKANIRPGHAWWCGSGSCVGSGTLLVLLPKCPACVAAYLALATGAGVAMPLATHLRSTLEFVFLVSFVLILSRWISLYRRESRQRVSVKSG